MECPHCTKGIHPAFYREYFYAVPNDETQLDKTQLDKKGVIYYNTCPECSKYIVYWNFVPKNESQSFSDSARKIEPEENGAKLVYPMQRNHKPLSNDIPSDYISDFEEAYSVIDLSPKASAALSRRLLQRLLEEKGGAIKNDLSDEIQQIIDSKQLPQHLSNSVDAIRNIGNFSAHPIKSQVTGQIVDVEDEEAEWNLDVLDGLFDFYFVQPAAIQKKKDALNAKLTAHGKPLMK
jgi:hypothetical protein